MTTADAKNQTTTGEYREFTPLNAEDKKLLDERLAELREKPDSGEPWDKVLAELRALL
jgi:hypothetical protein